MALLQPTKGWRGRGAKPGEKHRRGRLVHLKVVRPAPYLGRINTHEPDTRADKYLSAYARAWRRIRLALGVAS